MLLRAGRQLSWRLSWLRRAQKRSKWQMSGYATRFSARTWAPFHTIHIPIASQNHAVLEMAELRAQVTSERARADAAAAQAKELLASNAASADVQEQLIKAQTQAREQSSRVEHLEGIVHRECLERTFLLDQLNDLRVRLDLPPLKAADISDQAAAHASAPAPTSARSPHAGSSTAPHPAPASAAEGMWTAGGGRLARDKGVRRRGQR